MSLEYDQSLLNYGQTVTANGIIWMDIRGPTTSWGWHSHGGHFMNGHTSAQSHWQTVLIYKASCLTRPQAT